MADEAVSISVEDGGRANVRAEDGKVVIRLEMSEDTMAATGIESSEVAMDPLSALTLAAQINNAAGRIGLVLGERMEDDDG